MKQHRARSIWRPVVTVVVGTGAVLFSPKDGSAGVRVDAGQRIVADATGVKGPGAEDANAQALATAQAAADRAMIPLACSNRLFNA